MEDPKKRWSVTYTKHVKQKRKVYQDGFLDLHVSSNKIKLYDECEKLLECKLLGQDQNICYGETLTFNGYLVDVGDPEGDHKPISDLDIHGRDNKVTRKPGLRNNSVSYEDRKALARNKVRSLNLSPSQKIIREFKKNELQKYGVPERSPDARISSKTEWQVLYTTQITQKAKKYHDGFLQVAESGLLGRQVMLFDSTRKLLGNRFLKKNEVISSGELLTFDAHLVEIGELEEKLKLSTDLKVETDCNAVGRRKVIDGQHYGLESNDYDGKEWQVMYTTQVTQKAKKYHDGFLRLAINGSHGRQIKLYDASGELLESRFLRKDEVIRCGESLRLDAHLIDVAEQKGNHQLFTGSNVQENKFNITGRKMITNEHQNSLKVVKSVVKEKSQIDSCSRENAHSKSSDTGIGDIKLSKNVPTNKALRDANQILSSLQKPVVRGNLLSGCTDKGMMAPLSFKEVHATDDIRDFPRESQLTMASMPDHGSRKNKSRVDSSENMKTGKSSDVKASTATPSCEGYKLTMDMELTNPLQTDPNNVRAGNKLCEEDFVSDNSSVSAFAAISTDDNMRTEYKEFKSGREMDECPSFDLGF